MFGNRTEICLEFENIDYLLLQRTISRSKNMKAPRIQLKYISDHTVAESWHPAWKLPKAQRSERTQRQRSQNQKKPQNLTDDASLQSEGWHSFTTASLLV